MSSTAAPEVSDKLDRSVIITGLVIVSGLIMVVLDTTIVNVALDSLSDELNAPLSTTQWVVTGYLIAVALVIPITGWAMDRFGSKPTWITAVTCFVIGSGLCATAWSIESLIAFRILQGLGGGMLMPAGQAMIARAAGPKRMGRAMAMLGVPMLLGRCSDPSSAACSSSTPVGTGSSSSTFPSASSPSSSRCGICPRGDRVADIGTLDWLGLVVLSGSLVCLLYGLSKAATTGGFGDAEVIGWLIGGVIGLALYTWHSLRKGADSIIDVRLLTNRVFVSSTIAVFLVAIGLFGGMLLLPLYYQTARGEGALNAGLLLAPQGLGAIVAMVVAGRLTDRIGAGYVVPVGVVLALIGTYPFTQVGTDTSYVSLSIALFVRGVGLGSVMMPVISSAYQDLRHDQVSRAAPTLSAIQQVGAALGSALLVTALSQRLTHQLAAHGVQTSGGGGSDQLNSIPPQAMPVVGPILADAFGFAFWVAFGLTAVIFIPAMFLPRHRNRTRGEASAPVL